MEKRIQLSYDALIGLLQGKELHLMDTETHIVIMPPFNGVFLTHDQITEIKYSSELKMLNVIQKLTEMKEEIKLDASKN